MFQLSVLGTPTDYPSTYTPSVLQPVPRALGRDHLLGPHSSPCYGWDIWTAFELSWLAPSGRPCMAAAELTFQIDSPHIIESKSLKLYLFSLNQTVFADEAALRACIERDLSRACGAPVGVRFLQTPDERAAHEPKGICIDGAPWQTPPQPLAAQCLQVGKKRVTETLYSEMLRSLCPVTAQPDWATVVIHYTGPRIQHAGLLTYIASFRAHQGFHEQCVEQIYAHVMDRCRPDALQVFARYTRRGGLDINPLRSSTRLSVSPMQRLWRQ